ncbi:unnamed protein product [Discula destructiva]
MNQHVIFDFDGTITQDDTIGNIAHAALQWRKTTEGGGTDLTAAWNHILQSYLQDLAVYDQTQPPEQQRTTWKQERAYLHGRRAVEETSLARIREAGIFTGLAAEGRLFEAGRCDREAGRTRLRGGLEEYLAILRARDVAVHVVSVNWSVSYIRGVLAPWGITSVVANEIHPDGSIAGPPQEPLRDVDAGHEHIYPKALATSADKLRATRHLLDTLGGKCLGYFGDSTTDLECLDLCGGYAVTPDGGGSLVRTLRRLGCTVAHVSEPHGDGARISWARDFAEIAAHALDEGRRIE